MQFSPALFPFTLATLLFSSLASNPTGAKPRHAYGSGSNTGTVVIAPVPKAYGKTSKPASRDKALTNDQPTDEVPQRSEWTRNLVFSPQGALMISGVDDSGAGRGGFLRVWDVKSGQLKADLTRRLSAVTAFAFMPDGTTFVAADRKRLFLGEVATGKATRVLKDNLVSYITTLSVSADGQQLICLSPSYDFSMATFWELPSGKFKRSITLKQFEAKCLAISRQGNLLAIAGTARAQAPEYHMHGEVRIWDIANNSWGKTLRGAGQECDAIAFSPTKDILAAASIQSSEMVSATSVSLWAMPSGKLLHELGQEGSGISIAFSANGDTLVSSGSSWSFGVVRFWNPDTGKCRMVLTGRTDYIFSIALSPDGKTLAASALRDVYVGDLEHAPPKWKPPKNTTNYGANRLLLWDVANGKPLHQWSVVSGR